MPLFAMANVMNEEEILLETHRFRVVRQRGRTAEGTEYERATIQHPGAVTILPLVDEERICLIRNYRLAVDRTLIELPAGTLEPGEAAETTARRELAEETGFQAAEVQRLSQFYISPGILNERMYLYVARGLTQGRRSLEADEQIEPWIVTWEKALELVATGGIQDAKTLVGLMYYDRYIRHPAKATP